MNYYQNPYYWMPPLPPQGYPYPENPFQNDLTDQQSYI